MKADRTPAMLNRRRVVPVLAAGAMLGRAVRAEDAAIDPALYQATAIVTGTDMRQRPLGFAQCLTEVLVKLSGQPRLRGDPAVAALATHAETLVADFTYVDPRAGLLHHDDQGTYDRSHELTVRFDPAKTDAALAALGVAAWRGPRPLLTPAILVRSREPTPFLLSATTPRGVEFRESLVRLAAESGMGTHIPAEAEFAEWGVGLVGFPAPLGGAVAGRLMIAGSLSWNVQALGWVGTWQSGRHRWGVSGVGFDVAFADLVRGAVLLAAGTGAP